MINDIDKLTVIASLRVFCLNKICFVKLDQQYHITMYIIVYHKKYLN
jgi:hypothetical protein